MAIHPTLSSSSQPPFACLFLPCYPVHSSQIELILIPSAAGLTSLVEVATTVAGTPEGMALFQALSTGNRTVFAPSNEAFAEVPESVSSNTTLLGQILSYHVLSRAYTPQGVAVGPNHTIARTLLSGGEFALYGNQTQPIVLERSGQNATGITIVQGPNVMAMGPVAAANLQVYVIDRVLDLPANLSEIASSSVPRLATLIPESALTALQASMGFTLFAPTDAAVEAASGLLGTLNDTVVSNVLMNHVVNGTVAFSTDILGGANLTSNGGQRFSFINNATGIFVTSGNSTARIVSSDIIVENGVIHTIDGILANTASNASAADTAFTSATGAAATMTQATAPVTQTSNPAMTSAASGSARPSGAASPLIGTSKSMIGGAIGLVAAVVGGAFVLV